MIQQDLLQDVPNLPERVITVNSTVTHATERARLKGQCAAILARLEKGPATNRELADISLKYTGRISDLRKSGYDIRLVRQDHGTGFNTYELQGGVS